jgi:glycerol-3-phosphate dehydrogenase
LIYPFSFLAKSQIDTPKLAIKSLIGRSVANTVAGAQPSEEFDELSGRMLAVEAKVVVNAAGPWVDEVLRGSDAERHEPLMGGTKGSHLVVDWPGGPQHAIFASAKSDGRPFFILPWYRYTLIGTTDIRYDGDPSKAQCTLDELRYLIDEATRLLPSTPLRAEQVLYTYCGVRPLPATPKGAEAAITRKHFVIDHVKRGGPRGLLSIVGGKLTTYRSMAEEIVDHVERLLGRSPTASSTAKMTMNVTGSVALTP